HPALPVAARIVVIPAAGVKGTAFEILEAWDAGQLRRAERTIRHHDELRLDRVAAMGMYDPARDLFIPTHLRDFGLEAGVFVEIEGLGDSLAMRENFRAARVFFR